jgi:hypothetical protein
MSQHAAEFSHFDAESYLARRLKDHGVLVFIGVTDPAIRKERFRKAILEGGKDCVIVGRNTAGKVENYSQLFQRIYGEPLEGKRT